MASPPLTSFTPIPLVYYEIHSQKKKSGANFPLLLSPDKLAPVPLARRPRNSLQFEILELGAALAKAARPT